MRISGQLESGGVRAVLRVIGKGRSSGVLRLRTPESSGQLVIVDGRVLRGSLDDVPALGDVLVAKGVVSRDQVAGALSIQKRSRRGRPIGQILVELGLVERGDVGVAIDEQIHDVVAELLAWRRGSYAFEPLPDEEDNPASAGIEIEELLSGRVVSHQ